MDRLSAGPVNDWPAFADRPDQAPVLPPAYDRGPGPGPGRGDRAPSAGTAHRGGFPIASVELDTDLARAMRHTSVMRQLFYVVVLLVALAGQISGAVQALAIPLVWAIPAVGALELGGIVVLANADVRRRLGERAIASRALSAAIAAFAVTFNWMAHSSKLLAGFFAGMSALGYLVWLMHTENQRRDRLRATGDLPPTTPAYELVGHWVRHPWLTLRAKNLAKAEPRLGLYTSIAGARAEVRRERRTKAIAAVLYRKIRAAVEPTTADIAVAVYDLDKIAERLTAGADYNGLTALIAVDLAPARLAAVHGHVPPTVLDPVEPIAAGQARTIGDGSHDVDGDETLETIDDGVHHGLGDAEALKPLTHKDVMWMLVEQCRLRGESFPTAAELDRHSGSRNYGSRVAREWRAAGLISEEEYHAAISGRRRRARAAASNAG